MESRGQERIGEERREGVTQRLSWLALIHFFLLFPLFSRSIMRRLTISRGGGAMAHPGPP